MRHVISMLLQNEAGALARVAGLFASRGYNIESLNVAPTPDRDVSRLALVIDGDDATVAQIIKQSAKLVDVLEVEARSHGDAPLHGQSSPADHQTLYTCPVCNPSTEREKASAARAALTGSNPLKNGP